ncbi:phage terminase large subunit [Pedobacter arcticus]|uniref:phage terminase large subunit n=1 Tax=Pedobacter arcticus TaxID=752140 RepID=UPI0003642815|nr:phage terminase large subunit [Pedobacter arcticus]
MANSTKYQRLIADYDKHCLRIARATTVNIHETERQKRDRIAELEKDYVKWFEYYFPNFAKKKCAWFHIKLAAILIASKRIRLLAEMFRSAGKSVHVAMGIPLFLYLVKSELKFMLLIGKNQSKANTLISGIQGQLQFNKRLINDYGEKFNHGSWADGDFTTSDGVKFMALGFGSDPRGVREDAERPDYIVCDDVDGKKHLNNDRIMEDSVDYITEDIWGCFDADDDATERFVYTNNNFNKKSITNRLKTYYKDQIQKKVDKRQSDRKHNIKTKIRAKETLFEILSVNAVKDLSTFEPSWPEKTTADYWRDKFENMPYRSFMREYMNTHIEDGAIFKFDDILYCEPYKLKEYDALCFYGDLSYKAQGDYKALVLVGKKGRQFHILICYVRQKSRGDVARWLYDTYEDNKLQNVNIRYLIEGLFAMDDFVNDFDLEGDSRGYHIPVVADKRAKGDKFDRIESLSGHFERHNVFFSSTMRNSDMQTLIDQLLAFEKGSQAHDDGPDAVHGAFNYVNMRTHKKANNYRSMPRANRHY